jgi:uncharacterized protein YcfJ
MDKSMVKGVVIGGIAMVVLAAGGVTGYRTMTKPTFAEVVAVREARQAITTPQEKCEQVKVQKQAPFKDEHRATGTVIGGVAGGPVVVVRVAPQVLTRGAVCALTYG